VTGFISVRSAYERWRQIARLQTVMLATMGASLVLGLLLPAFISFGSWAYLEGSRKLYRTLFWNQALALHSSKLEGEPKIYEFMTKRHQREHARLSVEKFGPRKEEK
jgi:hypothetical protein